MTSIIYKSSSRIIQFLCQNGDKDPKHSSSWKHPLSTFLIHYIITTTLIIYIHDYFLLPPYYLDQSIKTVTKNDKENESKQIQIANFMFIYFVILLGYRIATNNSNRKVQKTILYENTWLCNTTLFMGALGLWTDRHVVVLSHVVAVSIDQVLWYVDLTGWVLSGFQKFPIGVAKYITWPQTSWATRITCTHHVWTIPLLIYACNGFQYPIHTYILSGFVIVINVCTSRWLTPFTVHVIHNEDEVNHYKKKDLVQNTVSSQQSQSQSQLVYKYLNVNLSHELWKDITSSFSILQIKYDNPGTAVYLFRLLWRWQLFNGVVFVVVLHPLSKYFFLNGAYE
mmetsp:Transcript_4667/g.6065  ORF Transcript_4667/g.6065 Transcript_4667/m.6065 type:complete len:339 (-) Transcript_4667:37-1053(-)